MKNLAAEMVRNGVSVRDIQQIISCTERTVHNKLDGITDFSVTEAIRIRDAYFPGMRLAYLFAESGAKDAR